MKFTGCHCLPHNYNYSSILSLILVTEQVQIIVYALICTHKTVFKIQRCFSPSGFSAEYIVADCSPLNLGTLM